MTLCSIISSILCSILCNSLLKVLIHPQTVESLINEPIYTFIFIGVLLIILLDIFWSGLGYLQTPQ